MNYKKEIIEFIRRNRVSTTEVADALGKSGVIPRVAPLTPDLFEVGSVRCIFTANDSNYALHEQIREIKEGEIPIIFAHACEGRAVLGDLISKYILLYRKAAALVLDGLVRDAARLRRERYGIWALGASPLGCYNRPADAFPEDKKAELLKAYNNGVAVCDDGGVTVISEDLLNADTLERLERIELQEDIWFYCLDTLKWDTKKIVCDKAYLKEKDVIPAAFAKHFETLSKPLDAKK